MQAMPAGCMDAALSSSSAQYHPLPTRRALSKRSLTPHFQVFSAILDLSIDPGRVSEVPLSIGPDRVPGADRWWPPTSRTADPRGLHVVATRDGLHYRVTVVDDKWQPVSLEDELRACYPPQWRVAPPAPQALPRRAGQRGPRPVAGAVADPGVLQRTARQHGVPP